jgi:hypothetical protein
MARVETTAIRMGFQPSRRTSRAGYQTSVVFRMKSGKAKV